MAYPNANNNIIPPPVDERVPELPHNNPGIVAGGPHIRNLHLERDQENRRDRAAPVVITNSRFLAKRPLTRPPLPAASPNLETALFSIAVNHPPSRVTYPSNSTYIPSFSSAYYYLNTMDQLMASTKNWTDNCFGWVPPYSQIYIGMLLYFQVMRAMEKAGALRPSSELSNLLRDVSDIYPFENLMVPGPLVCLFENLTAFRPFSNGSYGNVTPFLPNRPGWSKDRYFVLCNEAALNLPNIPLMISRLREICTTASQDGLNDLTFQASLSGPRLLSSLFGHDCAQIEQETALLASPGAGLALPGDLRLWREANSQLQRSDFPPALTLEDNMPPNAWASFLNLDNDLSWFSPVAAMMNKYCQYWRGSVPLSSIPADGSAAGSVRCVLLEGSNIHNLAAWTPPVYNDPAAEGAEPQLVTPGYYTLNPNPTLIFDASTTIEDIPQANLYAAITYQFNLEPFNAEEVRTLNGQFWRVRPNRHTRNNIQMYPSVIGLLAREYHSVVNLTTDA